MSRTYVKDVKSKIGESVTVSGFVHTLRDQGSIKFLLVRDVTGIIQTVILKNATKPFELAKSLTTESVVEVTGLAKESKPAPGGLEIEVESIVVLSLAAPELPIPVVEKAGDETSSSIRFDWRWLDLRKPEKQQIFKVWTELENGFRKYFSQNNFIQIYTPSFMSTASESGAEVFEVSYFETKSYLAQSPQFYKQMAMASGFEKVFMTGPVYRAEPSFTTRHMTEFTGWDFEVSYIDSHHDVMAVLEDLIASSFTSVKEATGIDIEVPAKPFPKITMAEAKKMLADAGVKSDRPNDVNPEEERKLAELVKEKEGHDFVFLTDYPIEARPFYHMRHAEAPNLTKSFDLIYKGVEVVTGAQREHRIEVLEKQAKEKGMSLEALKDYLNFFRYGCPPHGGVGIGPGRIIMKLLDLPSVKEAAFLPRDVRRLRP